MLSHVFKIRHGLDSPYLAEYFKQLNSVHSYSTRLSHKGAYALATVKSAGSKTFSYMGAKLWNELPSNIIDMNDFSTFKSAVICHFLDSWT